MIETGPVAITIRIRVTVAIVRIGNVKHARGFDRVEPIVLTVLI